MSLVMTLFVVFKLEHTFLYMRGIPNQILCRLDMDLEKNVNIVCILMTNALVRGIRNNFIACRAFIEGILKWIIIECNLE